MWTWNKRKLRLRFVSHKNKFCLISGLSSFENNPDAASDHIKELLLFAARYIPEEKHAETSLYVMATAGMRMLSERLGTITVYIYLSSNFLVQNQ